MVKKEDGYAMVIVLIVITVLLLLSGSLSVLISGEISLSSNNFKRIIAKYNAETGIEEGIHSIMKDNYTLDDEVSSNNWNQGSYDYTITKPSNYIIDSTGNYRDKTSKITVEVVDTGYDKSFIYGNQFTLNRDESLDGTVLDDLDDNDEALIENYTDAELLELFESIPSYLKVKPPTLYRQFIINYYFDGNESDYQDNDTDNDGKVENYPFDSYPYSTPDPFEIYKTDSTYFVKQDEIYEGGKNGPLFTFEQNAVYHYRSNLTFEAQSQTEEVETYDDVLVNPNDVNPPLIAVDGDLIIKGINEVRGFLFLVKGDIIYEASNAAKSQIDHTLLYTEGSFNYYRDQGNESDTPHLDIDGQIIANENINIKIRKPNTNSANHVTFNWPPGFDYDQYMGKIIYGVKIIRWEE